MVRSKGLAVVTAVRGSDQSQSRVVELVSGFAIFHFRGLWVEWGFCDDGHHRRLRYCRPTLAGKPHTESDAAGCRIYFGRAEHHALLED
jgi:hypothetical protein